MTTVFAVILILAAGILTIGVAANVGSLHTSDAAGNGMADAFAWFGVIGLWIILSVLLLVCGARGGFSRFSGIAMLFPFVLGIAGQIVALEVLTASKVPGAAATLLPIVITVAPMLVIIRAAWGIFPDLRSSVPEIAGGWAPIVLLVLISLVPFLFRPAFVAKEAAARAEAAAAQAASQQKKKAEDDQRIQETLDKIAALAGDSHLFSAIVYCADAEPVIREAARAKARSFSKRQAEAEELLGEAHGATLRELPNFDLAATPKVCESAKKMLAAKAAIQPFDNDPIRIEDAEREVAPYIETMRWLLANGCDCKAEIAGLEQSVARFARSQRREKLLADLAAVRMGHQ